MMFLNTLFNTASMFFTASVLLVFLHCFYDTRYRWTMKKGIALIILYAVCAIIYTVFGYEISIFMIPAEFFIITYDYPGNKFLGYLRYLPFNLSFTIGATFIGLIGTELLFPNSAGDFFGSLIPSAEPAEAMSYQTLFDTYEELFLDTFSTTIPDSIFLFVNILTTLFFGSLFFYMYFRLYRRDIFIAGKLRERLLLILFPVFCVILWAIIYFIGKDSNATLILLTFMSILFALLIPVFFYSMRISQHYRERTAYQENYMQAELEHFTQYKVAQEETRLFRHDIRNNLLCISEMLRDGKTEDASNYLQELLNTTEGLRQKYVSGDEMLDCIIGVKSGVMCEKGIRFQLDGVLAGGLNWKPVDVCCVFANALDNAIEACEQLPHDARSITMRIKSTDQFWFISIENPVKNKVDTETLFKEKDGYTTKKDTGHHGIGTYNMKHALESYGGMLKAESDADKFLLEIMIHRNQTVQ